MLDGHQFQKTVKIRIKSKEDHFKVMIMENSRIRHNNNNKENKDNGDNIIIKIKISRIKIVDKEAKDHLKDIIMRKKLMIGERT